MVPRMQLPQPLARHVGVDGGRRDVGVAQQHLHRAQVGAVVQQVGREGVAQRVRRQRRRDAGGARVALDQLPEHLPRHRAAARGDEQRVAGCAPAGWRARLAR
jgi:hypothetical protein